MTDILTVTKPGLKSLDGAKLQRLLAWCMDEVIERNKDDIGAAIYVFEDEVSEALLRNTNHSYYVDIHSPTKVS